MTPHLARAGSAGTASAADWTDTQLIGSGLVSRDASDAREGKERK